MPVIPDRRLAQVLNFDVRLTLLLGATYPKCRDFSWVFQIVFRFTTQMEPNSSDLTTSRRCSDVIFCMMLERDSYLCSALANLAMGGKIHHTKHFHFSVSAVSRCFSQVPNCFYESFQLWGVILSWMLSANRVRLWTSPTGRNRLYRCGESWGNRTPPTTHIWEIWLKVFQHLHKPEA